MEHAGEAEGRPVVIPLFVIPASWERGSIRRREANFFLFTFLEEAAKL
jgi:hypothetical protein